jgi:hypothetical protein
VDEIIRLWQQVQLILQEMGDEAAKGGSQPYGLRGYAAYHRERFPGSFRKDAWEEPIMAELAMRLAQREIIAIPERPYPGGRGRCDLGLQVTKTDQLWIEFKTAYRETIIGWDAERTEEPRGKGSWKAGVADIKAKDIVKLNTLRRPGASYIGILLLGFDRTARPLQTEELYALLPTELDSWVAAHEQREGGGWPDRHQVRADKGFRDRLWFWYRPVIT